jgi:sphingolipid 4-desaturase/C4-monooxygenase
LFGVDPMTAVWLVVVLSAHMVCTWVFASMPWYVMLIGAYSLSAWMAFCLQVIGHEGVHRLVFDSLAGNRIVAILAFLPVFSGPFAMLWMHEHMQHHQTVVDKCVRYGPQQDPVYKKVFKVATLLLFINTVITITSTIMAVPLIIATVAGIIGMKYEMPQKFVRAPFNRFPRCVNGWMALNIVACAVYWTYLYSWLGLSGVAYQLLGAFFMNGLHPLGMRQVQEHYLKDKGQPTYSVYTSVAPITFNICYHVEHHDFANIPWSRLPALRAMAPEYYNNLIYYDSYWQVMVEFFTTPGIPVEVLLEG